MKAKLSVEVEFDDDKTDAESLASAADSLLRTVLSTPGILEEYGDPNFGEFIVDRTGPQRNLSQQEFGTERFCPHHADGHEPDWTSVHVEFDGEAYIDVTCKYCRRSGCVGSQTALLSSISW